MMVSHYMNYNVSMILNVVFRSHGVAAGAAGLLLGLHVADVEPIDGKCVQDSFRKVLPMYLHMLFIF